MNEKATFAIQMLVFAFLVYTLPNISLNSDKLLLDSQYSDFRKHFPQSYLFLLTTFTVSIVLRLRNLFIWLFLPNFRSEEWSELLPNIACFVFIRLIIVLGVVNINYPVAFVSWAAIMFTFATLHGLHLALERRYSFSLNRTDAFRYIYSLLFLINALLVIASFSIYFSPYLAGFNIFTWPNFVTSKIAGNRESYSTFYHVVIFIALESFILISYIVQSLVRLSVASSSNFVDSELQSAPFYLKWPNVLIDIILALLELIHNLHLLFWSKTLSVLAVFYFVRLRSAFLNLFNIFKMYNHHKRVRKEIIKLCPLQTAENGQSSDVELDTCSICWEKMNSWRLLPCSHKFHENCLWIWLEKNPICPICRNSLESFNSMADLQGSNQIGTNLMPNSILNYSIDFRLALSIPVPQSQARPINDLFGSRTNPTIPPEDSNERLEMTEPVQNQIPQTRVRYFNVRNAYNLDASRFIRGLPLLNFMLNQRIAMNGNQNTTATQAQTSTSNNSQPSGHPVSAHESHAVERETHNGNNQESVTSRPGILTVMYNFQAYILKLMLDFILSQFQSLQSMTQGRHSHLDPETLENQARQIHEIVPQVPISIIRALLAQNVEPEAIIDAGVNGRIIIQNRGQESLNEEPPAPTDPDRSSPPQVVTINDFHVARLKRLIEQDNIKLRDLQATRGLNEAPTFEEQKLKLFLNARTQFLDNIASQSENQLC